MPWWAWLIILIIGAGLVTWAGWELWREDPNRRALRAINKGKRG